jgi:hypothetical protein
MAMAMSVRDVALTPDDVGDGVDSGVLRVGRSTGEKVGRSTVGEGDTVGERENPSGVGAGDTDETKFPSSSPP